MGDADVLMACRVCLKNGWCTNCDERMDRCPLCRTSFSTRNVIIQCVPHSDTTTFDDDGYAEVEELLDHDFDTNEFLVQWADGDVTWEPAARLTEDVPELIQMFWDAQRTWA